MTHATATRREPALAAFSACRLCLHSAEAGLELCCTHPALRCAFAGPQSVAIARAPGGGCGPHAARMQARYLQADARPL